MVTNILLGAVLLTLVGSIIALRVLFRRFQSFIITFVTPKKKGELSPLYQTCDALAAIIARAVVAQAKTTLMGLESGMVRGEKAIQGDLALDVASQNPLVGAILSKFPRLSKSLRRNPALLDYLAPMVGNFMPKSGSGNGSPVSSGTPKFRL